jgi:hypothetical protein
LDVALRSLCIVAGRRVVSHFESSRPSASH